ncbi:GNAT family N-acetyltransferase [Nguyenibacter vanlangensis]|uniref:GNAT family N-acetyltransferase n=1 Tax=Nguyenibacter vanlangensis TaxID=1216886 RepID=A0ABZ3D0R0_9PROT
MIDFRPARADEAAVLTALCLRSKAVWGYDQAFLDACLPELSMTPENITASHVRVAESGGRVVGVACLEIHGRDAELDKLFVEPSQLGKGVGRALFTWAVETARRSGARALRIDCDPGAVPFYSRMGAEEDGLVPSGSIAGRMLPRMKVRL